MKKPLSAIASSVRASTTLTIDAMYKKMKASGIDVVGFGAGEPDFNTPEYIKSAAIKSINENFTRYTPSSGIDSLRAAVCKNIEDYSGAKYEPSQVVVSSGAKHNIYIALRALINPGDEVILPAPYWVSYYELILMCGGVPVVVYASEEQGFKMTGTQMAAAVTPKTKALILCTPSNPTGMIYNKAELTEIANICVKNGIYVISDEIYRNLAYDNIECTSFASLGDDVRDITILINGVSKSYSMTGWRIGYALANPEISKVMGNYQSHSTSAPSSVSQMAALAALTGPQDEIELMRQAFEERRNYFVERVNSIDGVSCIKPEGAFYIMMNISKLLGRTLHGVTIKDSDDFAQVFLEKGLVAVVPCTGFGAPEYCRWSYATSMENIKEGLDRLEKFLKD